MTRRLDAMRDAFPEAMVTGHESLVESMKNDLKGRHVLAAAVRCGAHAIITDNVRHFPPESLEPYGLECMPADKFLEDQYHLNPDLFISKLIEQALQIKWTLPQLIAKHVPSLAKVNRDLRSYGPAGFSADVDRGDFSSVALFLQAPALRPVAYAVVGRYQQRQYPEPDHANPLNDGNGSRTCIGHRLPG